MLIQMVVIVLQLGLFHLNINPDDTSKIKTYVGEDGKIHFVDRTGADSVLPFNKGGSTVEYISVYFNLFHNWSVDGTYIEALTSGTTKISFKITNNTGTNSKVKYFITGWKSTGGTVGVVGSTTSVTTHTINSEGYTKFRLTTGYSNAVNENCHLFGYIYYYLI